MTLPVYFFCSTAVRTGLHNASVSVSWHCKLTYPQ